MEETKDEVVDSQISMALSQYKEQNQDEVDIESSQYDRVGLETESMKDYTNLFMSSQAFPSRDALIEWVHCIGKKNNMVIIIQRSDSGMIGNKKKRPKIKFCCERGGYYMRILKTKAHCKNIQEHVDEDSRKKKRQKASGTKRFGCPFALRGINDFGDEWTLEVVCGIHNHHHAQSLHGHSYAGRLSKEEHAMLVDMSTSLIKPKDILIALKKRDRENVTTMKTIYNVRAAYRTKIMAGRSQIQCLLHKLREHNYIEHHRSEERQKTITWALSRLKTLLFDDYTPNVIITDRELVLMNSINKVFPHARHLLCKWHINKNVMKECKKKFARKEGWESFNSAWNTVVGSTSEYEYWKNLKDLESKFSSYPSAVNYVKNSWLDKYKERFVVACTDNCMHIGTTTSNRVESVHSKLKRQLKSSLFDFNNSWDNIHSLMELHHTDIKASFEKSRCFLQNNFKHDYLKELISYVSIEALNKIVCEAERIKNIKDLVFCGCAIRTTHGLPCAHEIAEFKRFDKPIPLDVIHEHWRQLGVGQTMHTSDGIDDQEKVPVKQHMVRLEKWVEQQNDERRREFFIKIDELMNPGSTFLKEPA
ncbi:uncharacterized protein LOC126796892 [Argentina anserina]|uniref:uncharacterized protein LOC126796892 n=1 Tax=Argentina anserina TaxID=57926 RepID=UPI0021761F33|nr:uncharacterized protein LOC126796892 [Potentilla anserina]